MKDIYARTNNFCLVFLTLVTATLALSHTKAALLPFIFAIFSYSILSPLVRWFQLYLKFPRPLAIFGSVFFLGLILSLIVLVLTTSIENFIQGASKYQDSLYSTIGRVEKQLSFFQLDLELKHLKEMTSTFLSLAQSFTGHLLSFIGNLVLVFIFTIFMVAGENTPKATNPLFGEILDKISSYTSAKFFLSVATGFIIWLILLVFHVELAFIFGLLTLLLNFIPTIGSIVAVILPLPLVFLQYQFTWPFFFILSAMGLTQFIIGNIIEPKILGDSMDLHPIAILIGLMFWGVVWGIPGMFLAVPITAVLKIVFSRIEATKPVSEILSGRIPARNI